MRTMFTRTALALALCLAASTAWAQPATPKPPPPDEGPNVHRLEIYNGPIRSVHYLSTGLSPSDSTALHDLERAENEVALADQMQQLRLQYVRDERVLQRQRTQLQQLLYGYSSDTSTSLYGAATSGPYGYGFAYPNNGYLYGPYGSLAAFAGGMNDASHSLAYGIGDEGRLKSELVHTLAAQATPEFAAHAGRELSMTLGRVGQSDSLRTALHVRGGKEPIATVGYEVGTVGSPVVVTRTLDGKTEKIEGTVLREDPDWMVLQTKDGRHSISKRSIVDVLEPAKK